MNTEDDVRLVMNPEDTDWIRRLTHRVTTALRDSGDHNAADQLISEAGQLGVFDEGVPGMPLFATSTPRGAKRQAKSDMAASVSGTPGPSTEVKSQSLIELQVPGSAEQTGPFKKKKK